MRKDSRAGATAAGMAMLGVVAALLIGGWGSGGQREPVTIRIQTVPAVVAPEPVPAAGEPAAAAAAEPPATGTALDLRTPRGVHPAIWVRAGAKVTIRTEPGGGDPVARIGRESRFGSPSVLGVVDRRGAWAGVTTALLPNDELGWVKLDPERVAAGWTPFSIDVDLSERSATLRKRGRAQYSFPVTVGAPGTSTPTGRFAVTDTFLGLDSAAYGCCALALSATQPSLPSGWLGGNTIAIHGTSGPLGTATSHGCVRAADSEVAELVRTVPLGSPVFIRA